MAQTLPISAGQPLDATRKAAKQVVTLAGAETVAVQAAASITLAALLWPLIPAAHAVAGLASALGQRLPLRPLPEQQVVVVMPGSGGAGRGATVPAGPPGAVRAAAAITLGVEEEFVLLDPSTGATVLAAPDLVRMLDGEPGIQQELMRFQVETGTTVCTSLDDLGRELTRLRWLAAAAAARLGCRLVASGVAIRSNPVDETLTGRTARPVTFIDKAQAIRLGHVYAGVRKPAGTLVYVTCPKGGSGTFRIRILGALLSRTSNSARSSPSNQDQGGSPWQPPLLGSLPPASSPRPARPPPSTWPPSRTPSRPGRGRSTAASSAAWPPRSPPRPTSARSPRRHWQNGSPPSGRTGRHRRGTSRSTPSDPPPPTGHSRDGPLRTSQFRDAVVGVDDGGGCLDLGVGVGYGVAVFAIRHWPAEAVDEGRGVLDDLPHLAAELG
jgi:Glutamate-cysteine ligase family 2(GCS2)